MVYVFNIVCMLHYQELTRKSISEARGSNVELNISLFTVPFFCPCEIVEIERLTLRAANLHECQNYLGGRGRFGRKGEK